MSIENPTAVERSVLRAIREIRPWKKEDLQQESENGSVSFKTQDENVSYLVKDTPLIIDGAFLSHALLSVSEEIRKSEMWENGTKKKERTGEELRERILKPARDEHYDGYQEIEGLFELAGFHIIGNVDLQGGDIPFPIGFTACRFEGELLFAAIHCRGIYFWKDESRTKYCEAAALDLQHAHIIGSLELQGLSGLTDHNEETESISREPADFYAYSLTVSGEIDARGFHSRNPVQLAFSKIGGNLTLDDVTLNPVNHKDPKIAINLEGSEIHGSIFCRNANINGRVLLIEANIEGRTEFHGTKINLIEPAKSPTEPISTTNNENKETVAINATEATFNSTIFFQNDFKARGALIFNNAKINGDLDFVDVELTSNRSSSLRGDDLKITGDLFLWKSSFTGSRAAIELSRGSIGGNVYCLQSTFTPCDAQANRFIALSLSRKKISGDVFFQNNPEIMGEINLFQSSIGGRVVFYNSTIQNPTGRSINLSDAIVGNDVFVRQLDAKGSFSLDQIEIAKNFFCVNSSFTCSTSINPSRGDWQYAAINLKAANIGQEFVFYDLQKIDGLIDLRQAHAAILVHEKKNWQRKKSKFKLDGFTYDSIGDYTYTPTPSANLNSQPDNSTEHEETSDEPENKNAHHKAITNSYELYRWLCNQPNGDINGVHFKPQPFTHLAEVLFRMGHSNDAKRILYERDKRIARNEQSIFRPYSFFEPHLISLPVNLASYVASIIVRFTAGYGHLPARAAVWAFFIWIIGAFIFDIAARNDLMRPAQEETMVALASPNINSSVEELLPIKVNGLLYAADVFLPIVDLSQQRYWLPKGRYEIEADTDFQYPPQVENLIAASPSPVRWMSHAFEKNLMNGLAKTYYWISIISGWLLTTIIVAALSGVLSKEK